MNVIAIDGPSGSGKSTISRLLAQNTNLPYLDSGAMYRAVSLLATRLGLDLNDEMLIAKCADDMMLYMTNEDETSEVKQRVIIDGEDVTFSIRTMQNSQAASKIAVHPAVRARITQRMRDWVGEHGGGVVEGRDIGSVVFPDATLKIFLTAHPEERAKRRQTDTTAPEFSQLSQADAQQEMSTRDHRDSNRAASPLTALPDAVVVDTTDKSIDEVVSIILDTYKKAIG